MSALDVTYSASHPDGMVQVPMLRSAAPSRARALESLVIFAVFAVCFGALGYWLIVSEHVVTFSALDRLSRAYLAWHNDPPKLAAIGFARAPLQTVALLPFTLVAPLATSLIALPVCSGVFGGLTMVTMNRTLERCQFPAILRYLVLIGFALVPTVAFYASDGGSQMISLALLAGAVGAVMAWFITVDTRYLISSGVLFSVAGLADYSSFVWMGLGAVMVAVTLVRHRASSDEVEGSLITYLAPSAYALACWTLFNLLIEGNAFSWLTGGSAASVNTSYVSGVHVTLLTALHSSLSLAWSAAPLSLVVIPALLICAFVQRNELAAWLAAFCLLALLIPGAEALMHHDASQVTLAKGLPLLLMSVYGAAWLYRSAGTRRVLVGPLLIAGLAVSVGLVWNAMNTFPYQNMEQAFHRAITTQRSQEATQSRGGLTVGLSDELEMARYIDGHITGTKSVLTDNAQTYGVILLSADPRLFVTRVDHGDKPWLRSLSHPAQRIRYMLIASGAGGDLIREAYPKADTGADARFSVVYSNQRYALVALAKDFSAIPPPARQSAPSQSAPLTFSQLQSSPAVQSTP